MSSPSLYKLDLRTAKTADSRAAPAWGPQLEEVAAAEPADWGAAFAFALDRIAAPTDPRPIALIVTRAWMRERGRPYARGLARLGVDPQRVILVGADRDVQALWALEETLKSGAVAGAVGTLEQADFVAGRRLDFAARSGRACGILVRAKAADDLSAARVRWRISALPSVQDSFDPRAPGPMRWRAEVVRRRDGTPAAFEWEEGDATPRLRLAAGLAGDGLVQAGRTHAAA
jgi:protein ImuA